MSDMFEDMVKQEKLEGHSSALSGESIVSPKVKTSFTKTNSIDVNNIYLGSNPKYKTFWLYFVYIFLAIILAIGVIWFFL